MFCAIAKPASAEMINAVWNSATAVPVIATGYTETDNAVTFTLNSAPATGTDLIVVSNTGLHSFAPPAFQHNLQETEAGWEHRIP